MIDAKMAATTDGKRVDFLSDKFDPLTALYSDNVQLPCPKAKPFNNLAEYDNVMRKKNAAARREAEEREKMSKTGGDVMGVRSSSSVGSPLLRTNAEREMLFRQMMQRAAKIKQDRMNSGSVVADLSIVSENPLPELMIKGGRQSSMSQRNVLARMKECGKSRKKGPLSLLYRAVEERIRVKVWTRSAKQLRGYCKGYIVAFDKHWNMAMVDVDEIFSKPCLPRTPYPSCKALEGEAEQVVTMNEEEVVTKTAEISMEVTKSTDEEEDEDVLALRLQMLKQQLREIASEEESGGSEIGSSKVGSLHDKTDGNVETNSKSQKSLSFSDVPEPDASKRNIVSKKTPFADVKAGSYSKDDKTAVVSKMEEKITKFVNICGGGDTVLQLPSEAIGIVDGGSGDVGTLREGIGKLQFGDVVSAGEEVVFDESDMEVSSYEEIVEEAVSDESVLDQGTAQVDSTVETQSTSVSNEIKSKSKQSSKKQLKSKTAVPVEDNTSSQALKGKEKGAETSTVKVQKSDKVKKSKDGKESSKDVKIESTIDNASVGERQKKSKLVKTTADIAIEPGREKKESKINRINTILGVVEKDSKSEEVASKSSAVETSKKPLSSWKIPKLTSKKVQQETKLGPSIGKSETVVDTDDTKIEKPSGKIVAKSDSVGRSESPVGGKSTQRIPKLSKNVDTENNNEKPVLVTAKTEKSPTEIKSELSSERPQLSTSTRVPLVSDPGVSVVQVPGDKQNISSSKLSKDEIEMCKTSDIVSKRLREVKETVRATSPSSLNSSPCRSEGSPDLLKKAAVLKPRKSGKSNVLLVKQPDPVRERLKVAGEMSAVHYLKGRLHERHLNKLFLRGDNVAMVNLL